MREDVHCHFKQRIRPGIKTVINALLMKNLSYFLIISTLLLSACRKEAGEGGDASINGRVMLEKRLVLSNPENVQYIAPAADQEVYIVYGDGPGPDDRIRTNYDGEFSFPYLREGEYEIYTYSKDTTDAAVNGQAPDMMAVRVSVTISDRKEEVNLPDLFIYD